MKTQIYNKVVARMLIGAAICVSLLSACIKDDLSDCPPPTENGKICLDFVFKMHNEQEDGQYKDLFVEYAQKTDIYIFDQNGVFVHKITEIGPFGPNHRTELELPPGRYSAVVWANIAIDAHILLNAEPIVGVTKKEDMSVQLASITDGRFGGAIQPLLWGQTDMFTVFADDDCELIVVHSGLLRDDHRVKINIKWVENAGFADQRVCAHRNHADSTRLYIDDNNGILGFDNIIRPMNTFTYMPTHTVEAIVGSGEAYVLKTQTDMLRLMKNSPTTLRVCRIQPDGSEKEVYRVNLREKYLDPIYTTQEALDRRYEFNIDIALQCDKEDFFIAVSVVVDGWRLHDNGNIEI